MSAPSVLIAGCGDIGGRLASQLRAEQWQVYGLRRTVSQLPAGVVGVAGDLFNEQCPADWPTGPLDYVVYSVAATEHDEAGYRAAYVQGLQHVLSWLKQHGQQPKRLLFVSSSSVYGQKGGEWVDESSPTVAGGYSGRLMLEAEQVALDSSIPASRVRLTGIYGPGREWLLSQVRQGYSVVEDPPLRQPHPCRRRGGPAGLPAGSRPPGQAPGRLLHRRRRHSRRAGRGGGLAA